jgi:hypothetical protein
MIDQTTIDVDELKPLYPHSDENIEHSPFWVGWCPDTGEVIAHAKTLGSTEGVRKGLVELCEEQKDTYPNYRFHQVK